MVDSHNGLQIGAVIIGRNEGQRLITCLDSLLNHIDHIVYVDSGSTDNSLNEAQKRGVDFISLDISIPFTAARARNQGANHLIDTYSKLKYIQFIDGDCEIQPDWIEKASIFLEEKPEYAVTCGRRRERYPDRSIYNLWCDIEWDTPIGDALACGGDALIRIDAFKQVKGYRDDLICDEEPEMCFRLREQGWKIRRIDVEMTLHDAAITKFIQWWKRTVRTGYSFAQGCSIHGQSTERYWVKQNQRIYIWGLLVPILILLLMLRSPMFLLLILIYPLQIIRVGRQRSDLGQDRFLWALGIVMGKIPEALGVLRFWFYKIRNKRSGIIEYK